MERNWGNINGSALIKGATVEKSKRSGRYFLRVELYVESELHSGKMWGHLPLEGLGTFRFIEFVRAVGFADSEVPGVFDVFDDSGVILDNGRLSEVLSGRVVGVYVHYIEFEGTNYLNVRRYRANGWVYAPWEGCECIVPEWWREVK